MHSNEQQAQSARLEQVELKLMDLELTVQQLNEVILRQYQDHERLQMAHEALAQKLRSAGDAGPAPAASDEQPPHY